MSWLSRFRHEISAKIGGSAAEQQHFRRALFGIALAVGVLVSLLSPWRVFAAVFGVAVMALTFSRPGLILMFLAAYTPFEPFLLKFVGDDIYVYARYFSEVLIYLLLAAAALRHWLLRRKWRQTPIDLPLAFFLLVALASLVINTVPVVSGILGVRQIVRFIILFYAVVLLEPDRPYIRRFTLLMFGVTLFEAALGALQAVVGAPLDEFLIPSDRRFFESIQLTSGTEQTWSPGTRVFATLGRYDQLGTFLSFFMTMALGFLYGLKDKLSKNRLFWFLAACLPALVMTLSRASWFGFLLAVVALGGWLMKDVRVRYSLAAVALIIVAYAGVSGLVVRYMTDYPEQTLVERFFEAFSYERWRGEYFGLGRLFWIVQTPTVVVRSSPLFGVGPGQYGGGAAAALGNTRVYERLNLPFGVYGTEGYIDNNWFSLWGETGTLGLAFYFWMFVALGQLALSVWHRSHDQLARGLALGFFGCLIAVSFQSFLATYLEVRTLALYFWCYAAFLVVLARKESVS